MKTVLFWDFDGTLASAPHIWSTTLLRCLKEELPDTQITLPDIRRYTAVIYPWDTPWEDHRQHVGERWWPCMEAKFRWLYGELGVPAAAAARIAARIRGEILNPAGYQVFPDAAETLARCMELGYRNYILSNNYPELEELMEALGLLQYFDGLIISGLVGYDKPRPELFAYAKECAGDADRYYMIGDNPKADVEGGRAAGMHTILVHKDVVSAADYTVQTLREIPAIL